MTEGIIQKVIDKRILHYLNAMKGVQGFVAFAPKDIAEDFVYLEQELIKEIENLDKEYYEDKDGKWTYEDEEKRARLRIIRELIGETKE